jgi:hypothetical protein
VVDNISKPLTIYYDNKAKVFSSHNNKSSGMLNTLTLDICCERKSLDYTINLEHICTKEMLVDPLTKDLPYNIFEEHIAWVYWRTFDPGWAK